MIKYCIKIQKKKNYPPIAEKNYIIFLNRSYENCSLHFFFLNVYLLGYEGQVWMKISSHARVETTVDLFLSRSFKLWRE